jgi:hypothetical protein
MADFVVQPNCYGIDLPNGHRYEAKNCHVNVTDPADAKFIEDSYTRKGPGYLEKKLQVMNGGESKLCDGCGFNAFEWQRTCPRCENQLPTKENKDG